jgi:sirohydrochlorin ferrochelatase
LDVHLCYLDVETPALADALTPGPTVVLPMLLSTGYHVQTDIPTAVAGHDEIVVARHLGPHELLADALTDRLLEARSRTGRTGASTVLVAAGSRLSAAADETRAMADLLGARLGRDVVMHTLADDLAAAFTVLPQPVEVATYLLGEGQFSDAIAAADPGGPVAAVLGAHPAVIALVLRRFDEAVAGR